MQLRLFVFFKPLKAPLKWTQPISVCKVPPSVAFIRPLLCFSSLIQTFGLTASDGEMAAWYGWVVGIFLLRSQRAKSFLEEDITKSGRDPDNLTLRKPLIDQALQHFRLHLPLQAARCIQNWWFHSVQPSPFINIHGGVLRDGEMILSSIKTIDWAITLNNTKYH